MERMSAAGQRHKPPTIDAQVVEGLLGATATRHILYLLDGQYLYQSQSEDGSIRYKFLSAQAVRLAFSHEPVDSGWLDPGIFRWGYSQAGQWAVLFIPPAIHTLWLPNNSMVSNGDAPDQIEEPQSNEGLLAVQVPLPALIFVGAAQRYYLWAVKARAFNPQLALYHAPLPNVYGDGGICWGSNQVVSVTTQTLRDTWKLFISSPFNVHLAQSKSKRYSTNILDQLSRLGANQRKTYPARDLLPLIKRGYRQGQDEAWTINELVDQLITTMERVGR